ncbi:MAG: response regulator, partial [Bacteroidetes bacterium]|nr:response regulator [Bacteroidota bacterium]
LNKVALEVDVAGNGLMAIQMVKDNHYDLVLMDLQMPEMDGYQATNMIRNEINEVKRNIPIIAMTAHAMSGEKEKCIEAGMNDYITKPFDPVKLIDLISKYTYRQPSSADSDVGPVTSTSEDRTVKLTGLDLSMLETMASGSKSFMAEMIEMGIKQMPDSATEIKEAYDSRDWASMKSMTHKLKSSLAIFGSKELTESLKKLDSILEDDVEDHRVGPLVDKISVIMPECIELLKQELKDLDL